MWLNRDTCCLPPGADLCVLLDVPQAQPGRQNTHDFGSDKGLAHRLIPLSDSFENCHPGPGTRRITN